MGCDELDPPSACNLMPVQSPSVHQSCYSHQSYNRLLTPTAVIITGVQTYDQADIYPSVLKIFHYHHTLLFLKSSIVAGSDVSIDKSLSYSTAVPSPSSTTVSERALTGLTEVRQVYQPLKYPFRVNAQLCTVENLFICLFPPNTVPLSNLCSRLIRG